MSKASSVVDSVTQQSRQRVPQSWTEKNRKTPECHIKRLKVKAVISSWWVSPWQNYTQCHLPYGITQCYLPPDTSEYTPVGEGWYSIYLPRTDGRLSSPWLCPGRESNPRALDRKYDVLTATPPEHRELAGAVRCWSCCVDIVDGPTMTPPSPGHCQRGEVPCNNGVCIPLDYLCDGDYDCTDRSDEANCGQSTIHGDPQNTQSD